MNSANGKDTPAARTSVAQRAVDRRRFIGSGAAAAGLTLLPLGVRAGDHHLRVASLRFGSFNWLLETIEVEGIAEELGLKLDIVQVATNQAGPVALLAGEADVIISDWPWAMRQRSEGEAFKFHPYSTALGAIMVPERSGIESLKDLKGKRFGVAGSSIDKSWLMLRSYAKQSHGLDLVRETQPVFGAAPLIAEQIRQGRVAAALNFWTFSARLKAGGYRELLSMTDVLEALKIAPVPAMVGFVYRGGGDDKQRQSVNLFVEAVRRGNDVLARSDAAWERLRPLVRAKSDAELMTLRDVYRSGIPEPWSAAHTDSARALFDLLRDLGERSLLGGKVRFDADLFNDRGT